MSAHEPSSILRPVESGESSEVQSAHQTRAIALQLLEIELGQPTLAAAIGGPLVWDYDLEEAVHVLRTVEIEAALGAVHRAAVSEITGSASLVFAAVQDHLRPLRGYPDPLLVHSWRLQSLAKRALLDITGRSTAVRKLQAEAVEDEPLTVCFGRAYRTAFEAAIGLRGASASELSSAATALAANDRLPMLPRIWWSHGDGCGTVHCESTSTQRLLTIYCNRCAKLSGNKQRRVERFFWAQRHGAAGGLRNGMCGCGNGFERTRANQTRCPECRRQHRKRCPSP